MSCYHLIDASEGHLSRLAIVGGFWRFGGSGYYAWLGRPPSPRESGMFINAAAAHMAIRGYTLKLKSLGVECGRRRVARLMGEDGLRSCMRGRRRSTTRRDDRQPPAHDLVERRFLATCPDRLWFADITYIPSREGFLYLAFILDACTRKVVGWSLASHLRAELVMDALEMALWRRGSPSGVIHHSERGSQYMALFFGERLEEEGVFPSMGRVGSALDNAMAESFVSTLKAEIGAHVFADREAARVAVFDYIEGFYNPSRRHSSIGYLSPADYELAITEEVRAA